MCAARHAPFGTDIQPKTRLKIVGGKQIEVRTDQTPPQSADDDSGPATTGRPRRDSPNILTQQNFNAHDYDNTGIPQQNERGRKKHFQSADADKYNSQIHRNGFPGSPSILPPIKSTIASNPLSWPEEQGQIKEMQEEEDYDNDFGKKDYDNYMDNIVQSGRKPAIPSPEPVPHFGRPSYSLTEQLRDLLDGYDSYSFQDMYTDATDFDRRLTGFINQPQMNMLCLRHRLPLDSSMLRILFSSFSKDDNPDLVNYEKLIKYMARAQLGSKDQANTLLDDVIQRFVETRGDPIDKDSSLEQHIAKTMHRFEFEEPRNKENKKVDHSPRRQKKQEYPRPQEQQQPRKKRSAQGDDSEDVPVKPIVRKQPIKVFSDREDAKLLMLIEQQLIQGKEDKIDIDALTRTFSEMDRSRLGTVSQRQITEACFKHRIPVQGSIMEKLLQRCDLGDGLYSWVKFVEILERVQPINMTLELSPRSKGMNVGDPPRPGTWPKKEQKARDTRRKPLPATPPEPAAPPWETRKPLARLGRRETTPSPEAELQHIRETPSPTQHVNDDSYQRAQLKVLAKQNEQKRIKQIQAKAAKEAGMKKDENWFERFMHLAQGLYNADSTNSGYLQRSEIRRLVNNYNLIYHLTLDDGRIDKAIATCAGSDGLVAIEPLLESLRLRSN
ncbi:uncharacterized protein C1orf87-like [Ptychodera flava]|uniref:uncharacterized protein C1orf87-like n=1 Tax=Ptychodera flava TaxID=63121 RepID=UPI003969F178